MHKHTKPAPARRHVGTASQNGGWVVFFATGQGSQVRYVAKTATGERPVTRDEIDKALRENSK